MFMRRCICFIVKKIHKEYSGSMPYNDSESTNNVSFRKGRKKRQQTVLFGSVGTSFEDFFIILQKSTQTSKVPST